MKNNKVMNKKPLRQAPCPMLLYKSGFDAREFNDFHPHLLCGFSQRCASMAVSVHHCSCHVVTRGSADITANTWACRCRFSGSWVPILHFCPFYTYFTSFNFVDCVTGVIGIFQCVGIDGFDSRSRALIFPYSTSLSISRFIPRCCSCCVIVLCFERCHIYCIVGKQ